MIQTQATDELTEEQKAKIRAAKMMAAFTSTADSDDDKQNKKKKHNKNDK